MSDPHGVDSLPADASWPERIEHEINRRGGDATVGEVVDLMQEMGWRPPENAAVNAHEELVKASEMSLAWFVCEGDFHGPLMEDVIKQVRTALAKACGEQS